MPSANEHNLNTLPSLQGTPNVALELGISPTGRVHLNALPHDSGQPAPAVAARICKAFERGGASGLLHLGASELGSALPPSLAFGRELAHLFMARLCAIPDLAGQWANAQMPPPRTELEQLMARMPPMSGAEYLDSDRLEVLWAALQKAVRWGDSQKLFDTVTRARRVRKEVIEAGQDIAAPNFGRDKV